MSILRLEGVWARYPTPIWARPGPWVVEAVSLTVAPGAVVALVGASGGGKSTLARVAAGLLAPARGQVWREGRLATGRPAPDQVQVLFQAAAAHLPPHLSILDAMAESVAVHGGAERVEGLLTALGLGHRRDAPARSLSGGERRRAGVARLALARPRLLVLDEPTAGLDVHRAVEAMELLLGDRPPGQGVLLITHDLRLVRAFADRVAVVGGGRILEEGDAALAAGPHHPVTAGLLAGTPGLAAGPGPGCRFAAGCPLATVPGGRAAPPRLRAPAGVHPPGRRLACHVLAPGEDAPT